MIQIRPLWCLLALLFVAIVVTGVLTTWTGVAMTWHRDCRIGEKSRPIDHGVHGDRYLYTSCGTFEVADEPDGSSASDLFAALLPGHRYDLMTGGLEFEQIGVYPKILEARPR